MTHPSREYEDRLRRALRAAADSVEPSPDGLGRIRARLTPPRPVVAAWMVTETEPSMLRLRSLLNSLRLRIGRPRGQFRPAPAEPGRPGTSSGLSSHGCARSPWRPLSS